MSIERKFMGSIISQNEYRLEGSMAVDHKPQVICHCAPRTKRTPIEVESMQQVNGHTGTQILLFHPDLEQSKVNAALARAASGLQHVAIADMGALYPAGIEMERDSAREARRLLSANRIVLQFPMQWYSTPALMKQWQDIVLTRMGYVYEDTEGAGLAGKPLMIAATIGAEETTYRRDGRNHFTVAELLAPLRASANRFAMDWREPFLVYGAAALGAEDLARAAHAYRRALSCFATRASHAEPDGFGSNSRAATARTM